MDNTCNYCREDTTPVPADQCGQFENVGDACKCCGRVLVAKADEPTPQPADDDSA